MLYRWAKRFDHIDHDPTERLDAPITPTSPTTDRRQRARRRPRDREPADQTVAIFAAYAGLRAGEIARLRAEDILTHTDPPLLLVVDGKGGKQRLVPLHPGLAAVLATSDLPEHGYLFLRVTEAGPPRTIGLRDTPHVPPQLVSMLANRHLKDRGAGATFHQLRHAFATRLYAACHDLRVTQETLGHSSPATTAGYAAWSPERAAIAVQTIRFPTMDSHPSEQMDSAVRASAKRP
jgi:integrase/recombinase XerC